MSRSRYNIIKQIPWKIRDVRKQFLTNKLNEKKKFRCLVPEGMLINWHTKRFRLDSIDKAKIFYDRYIKTTEEQDTLKGREEDEYSLRLQSKEREEQEQREKIKNWKRQDKNEMHPCKRRDKPGQ